MSVGREGFAELFFKSLTRMVDRLECPAGILLNQRFFPPAHTAEGPFLG
jgi:hypothetical protein